MKSPPEKAGPLRFVPREVFARTSFPQSACRACKWVLDCPTVLDPKWWDDNVWLVRDEIQEDGRTIQRCGRDWKHEPPDVRRLRVRERAKLPEEWLSPA